MGDCESENIVLHISSEKSARKAALNYAYQIENESPLKAMEIRRKVFNNMEREELFNEIKPYESINHGLSYSSMNEADLRRALMVLENPWRCLWEKRIGRPREVENIK